MAFTPIWSDSNIPENAVLKPHEKKKEPVKQYDFYVGSESASGKTEETEIGQQQLDWRHFYANFTRF